MNARWILALGSTLCLLPLASGQPPEKPAEQPAHAELRAVREALIDAFKKRDLDGILKHLHKNVVVTWQNGEVSRGHDGVKAYYDKTMVGDKSIVVDVKAAPEVTELSVLYGGENPHTAVAYGKLSDTYKLRDGMDFPMNSLWSATLVKEDGRWQIVDYHASTNVFESPVTKIAVQKSMLTAGLAGLGLGAIIGILLAVLLVRLRPNRA